MPVEEVFVRAAPHSENSTASRHRYLRRFSFPPLAACAAALVSALLLVLSFPDFNFSPLAWVALVPVFVTIARRPQAAHGFFLGWIIGTVYFYATCYWLTYPMINYGGIPPWIAYPLLAPAALITGLFPALACYMLARACLRWGERGVLTAPFLWTAGEWARLEITGQLWNALGYSQAYTPLLIQAARWGGVFAVSFLLVASSAAISYFFVGHAKYHGAVTLLALAVIGLVLALSLPDGFPVGKLPRTEPSAVVIAVQPNVIPDFNRPASEMRALFERHLTFSAEAIKTIEATDHLRELPRVVIFPESPMNFQYTRDASFRRALADFAGRHKTSVLFNALEPTPDGGSYNSAVLVDAEGRLVEQYDKIQLLAFGEYVPLPSWLPGRDFVRAVVGEFTPGERYSLMPLGEIKSGVFICIESAFPAISRRFADAGADVLINISNDAYQGRTPVLRQHLANSVFRAVENNRPLLRVTNTGITARISPQGEVTEATEAFVPAVRTWTIGATNRGKSFYTRYGDLFAVVCVVLSVALFGSTLKMFNLRKRAGQ